MKNLILSGTIIKGLFVSSLIVSQAWAQTNNTEWKILKTEWSDSDLREYSQFVSSLARTRCNTVNKCLKGEGNPYRNSDSPQARFRSDCADLPYTLTAYFAWKKGLPFAHSSQMRSRGEGKDIRYSRDGNAVVARADFNSNYLRGKDPVQLLNQMVNIVSTAMFRTGPDLDVVENSNGVSLAPDYYPVKIERGAIRPGTVFYDPSGHVAVVYDITPDGRILMMDAHPDQSITYIQFGEKFGNSRSSHGAGFKNFRPLSLVGASKQRDGSYVGGKIVPKKNSQMNDYSTDQYKNSN